ncbi:AAA family ATPase [Williamsia maris]|uniref:AAA family ATPase n=1 Tax=Williamsia maris TaxID=72806 RepID=UPI0020A4F124|nr:AAA family ATPase [Williamsia maris]
MTDTISLKLLRATVTGVLDSYDHSIDFNVNDDYVIIYGPNGVGKTKTLEIIHALCRIDGRALSGLPFEYAEVLCSEGFRIAAENGRGSEKGLVFRLYRDAELLRAWEYEDSEGIDWLVENTSWRPLDNGLWEDRRDGEIVAYGDLEMQFGSELSGTDASQLPEEMQDFKERIPVYLIETQRLRTVSFANRRLRKSVNLSRLRRAAANPSRINAQADVMRTLINQAQTEHSRITQQLDRTFPNRVLEASPGKPELVDEVIREKYDRQNEFRSRLGRVVSVPLENELSLPQKSLVGWQLRLLDLYLSDADQKLAPFEGLLRRIELLEEIINHRLLRKRVQVNAADGLVVLDQTNERLIALDALSSGEQHETILMFDLLFTVPEGALVLIDEPEISLHVGWQVAFMPDIRRIASIRGLRFIVATHSPQIINGEWDKAVRLGPPESEF